MTAIATTISEDEFARWLRPSECFELLSPQWSYEIIRSTILRHLIHEQLLGRAGILIITGPNPKRTYRNALIPTSAWEADNPSSHSHFWDNGLFDFSDGMGFEEREFSCFDVRFDPVVIRGLVRGDKAHLHDGSSAGTEPVADSKKERLDESEVRRFAALYLQAHESAAKEIPAWTACKAIYPDHKVPRQYFLEIFRELRGPGIVGNPLFAKKL